MGIKNISPCSSTLNYTSEDQQTVLKADICPFCKRKNSKVMVKLEILGLHFRSKYVHKPSCIFTGTQASLSTHGKGIISFGGDTFPVTFSFHLLASSLDQSSNFIFSGLDQTGNPFHAIIQFSIPDGDIIIKNCEVSPTPAAPVQNNGNVSVNNKSFIKINDVIFDL